VSYIRQKFPSPDGKYTGFKATKKVGGHKAKRLRNWMLYVFTESMFAGLHLVKNVHRYGHYLDFEYLFGSYF
jgi:hypothetical protein